MLTCIPTNGAAGLDDTVCEHFGSAPYFTLFNSDTGQIEIIANRNSHHSHGTCHPMAQLARYHIDAIVCSGMGRRAIEALSSEGVRIYYADAPNVRALVDKIKGDQLVAVDPARACRGRGQHQGTHDDSGCHGHGHGQGRNW